MGLHQNRSPHLLQRGAAIFPAITGQRGAVVLVLLLVIVSVLAALLPVVSLPSAYAARAARTTETLTEAKAALLAYALTYPERHDGKGTPGLLPCPDLSGDGSAAGNCSYSGGTTLGRFPWRTVRARELRDADGELLWYAVADTYRKPLKGPLNSDTAGDLTADGANDIVAVIFAPGAPVEGQERPAGPLDPGNYLEGENAAGGTQFSGHAAIGAAAQSMNDQLVVIRRDELMSLVETRVLADAAGALAAYREAYGAYPWLSPFANPAESPFKGEAGARRGHLPFHWSGDLPGASPRNPFLTDVRWRWKVDQGTATASASGSVTEACLYATACADPLFPSMPEISAEVSCTWSGRDTAKCGPSGWIPVASVPCQLGCPGQCLREYRISLPAYAGKVQVHAPTPATVRTRDVTRSGTLPPARRAVEIRDRFIGATDAPACGTEGALLTGSGSIDFTPATTGSLKTAGIRYALDVDAGELPAWFVANRWHELVLAVYAEGEPLPGAAPACTEEAGAPGYPCLTLQGAGPPASDKRAMVLIAGRALPHAADASGSGQKRPSDAVDDYFEGLNAQPGFVFLSAPAGPSFNDQVRVVASLEASP
jgi:type II secretory pathway pseudopilin PulG